MTPKEKAKELFEKYSFFEVGGYTGKEDIKDMCKLCIDQIILEYDTKILSGRPSHLEACKHYWTEVEHELNLL